MITLKRMALLLVVAASGAYFVLTWQINTPTGAITFEGLPPCQREYHLENANVVVKKNPVENLRSTNSELEFYVNHETNPESVEMLTHIELISGR